MKNKRGNKNKHWKGVREVELEKLDVKNLLIGTIAKIEKCEADFKENEIRAAIEIYEEIRARTKTYGKMNKIINKLARETQYTKPNSNIPTYLKDNLEKELNDLPLTDRSRV